MILTNMSIGVMYRQFFAGGGGREQFAPKFSQVAQILRLEAVEKKRRSSYDAIT